MTKGIEVTVSKKRLDYVRAKLEKVAGASPVVTAEEAQPGVLHLLYNVMPRRWGDFMQAVMECRVDYHRIITE